MTILDQVYKSQLSKHGQTNPSGIWEGTPSNAAAVVNGQSIPSTSPDPSVNQALVNPLYGSQQSQQTYLDYLKAANQT